jgi:hypothetical protein
MANCVNTILLWKYATKRLPLFVPPAAPVTESNAYFPPIYPFRGAISFGRSRVGLKCRARPSRLFERKTTPSI